MKNISWKDLIGTWRNLSGQNPNYDFSVHGNGTYDLYNYKSEKRCIGEINSEYLPETNTVKLILQSCFELELFQIANQDIILTIENEKLLFKNLI